MKLKLNATYAAMFLVLIVSLVVSGFNMTVRAEAEDKLQVESYERQNIVYISNNALLTSYSTSATTVSEFLKEQNILLTGNATASLLEMGATEPIAITAEDNTPIADGMKLEIEDAINITFVLDNVESIVTVAPGTVQDVIDALPQEENVSYVVAGYLPTDELFDSMTLIVDSVMEVLNINSSEVPYSSTVNKNSAMKEGEQKVVQTGVSGLMETITKETYVAGVLRSSKTVSAKVVRTPINEVVEIGTKNTVAGKAYSKEMQVVATAYTAKSSARTYTGIKPYVGVIAVDPKVIPLGTKVYVEGYGEAIAADTGGSIKGNKIDLYYNTYDECIQFGRQTLKIYILD